MGELTKEDLKLISLAKKVIFPRKLHRKGVVGEVGCALKTSSGKIFAGVNSNLACDLGFCAEVSAISQMLSSSKDTVIKTIVAYKNKVRTPCGRCRELIHLIDKKNLDETFVIVSENEKVKLRELLPRNWIDGKD